MSDEFFPDARKELVGTRPEFSRSEVAASGVVETSPEDSASNNWSILIDSDTMETEIKRISQSLGRDVTTPTAFKAEGFKACRGHFSLLAVLWAVAAEFDEPVRWQDGAPGLRELYSQAGHNAKAGSDATYQEAQERRDDLAALVRGERPATSKSAAREADWSHVADRPPLMQRMNVAFQDRLSPWAANPRQFERNRREVRHEAQLVAMLAEVIQKEGFEFWDDETYRDYARELGQAATATAQAADQGNYERAREAIGRMGQACNDCHDGYRE
ncbi:MAG: cytochrome c [Pirellulaceae bacterium]